MEKSLRIIYTLLLCLLAVSANAQKNKKDKDEVKISAAKYDKFRDDIKLLSDSTKTLADSCTSLNSIIQNLQKEKEYLDDVIRNNKKVMDINTNRLGSLLKVFLTTITVDTSIIALVKLITILN